jgi:exopolyphosphatase/guanosine-5'-triphosphate,3'-diphosphate pyrophosphatase
LKLAAIDIGSNAARLLIMEVLEQPNAEPHFMKLNLVRVPLRLGFEVFETGEISKAKIEELKKMMVAFNCLIQIHQVDKFVACATSAMRDASNASYVIDKIYQATNIKIKVLTGKEEADTIFQNHIENIIDKSKSYLYIDVGGGSTELTLFHNSIPVFEESFNIGTIRILKNKVSQQTWQSFNQFIKEETKPYKNLVGIGSGGNINKIFSMSKKKEGKPISFDMLQDYYTELSRLSIRQRMIEYNLREDRADVILPAIQIYRQVMETANISEIYVPKVGLADGLVKNLYYNS